MKTKVVFNVEDYHITHYTRPMINTIVGGIFICMAVFFVILRVNKSVFNPQFFWPLIISIITFAIVCLVPYGILRLFPLGISIHKEVMQKTINQKTGIIEAILQLNSNNGYRYKPGNKIPVYSNKFVPGKKLTTESVTQTINYDPLQNVYGQYYGAYLTINGERYLIISSTWFKEGDRVRIKYLPNSKIILEMDYWTGTNNRRWVCDTHMEREGGR